jgi:geranylgeranyl reductase family protein
MNDWDVIIVGAGPAGSTAAIAALRADPSARVLLLDAAKFPRDKVCGDGIAPHALDVLRDLDVDPAGLVVGTAPVHRLRLRSPAGRVAARDFARPAYVVPRMWFDDRLLRAAIDAGATLRQHRVRGLTTSSDGVVVDAQFRARTLIAADGAESVVRRVLGVRRAPAGTVAVAVRGYASADRLPPDEQLLTMSAKHWPAYAWAFPIGNGLVNVGYGELLQGKPVPRAHLVHRLATLLPTETPTDLRGHRLPLSSGRPAYSVGRVLLVGDAASLINPLTGEGIFYAVLSGRIAGAAALTDDPARTYRDGMQKALGRHLRHTDAIARLGRYPALMNGAVAAARDRQSVFDTLVEVGLGAGTIGPRTAVRLLPHVVRRA